VKVQVGVAETVEVQVQVGVGETEAVMVTVQETAAELGRLISLMPDGVVVQSAAYLQSDVVPLPRIKSRLAPVDSGGRSGQSPNSGSRLNSTPS
jgi:hypothetical protein